MELYKLSNQSLSSLLSSFLRQGSKPSSYTIL